mgnify:CR=1 FL=1
MGSDLPSYLIVLLIDSTNRLSSSVLEECIKSDETLLESLWDNSCAVSH